MDYKINLNLNFPSWATAQNTAIVIDDLLTDFPCGIVSYYKESAATGVLSINPEVLDNPRFRQSLVRLLEIDCRITKSVLIDVGIKQTASTFKSLKTRIIA